MMSLGGSTRSRLLSALATLWPVASKEFSEFNPIAVAGQQRLP
jgi:hypothetical protein